MDSQPPPGHPPQYPSHQHQHHHQLQSNMMLGPNSAYNNSAAHHSITMINPNMSPAGSGFPFNSVAPPRQQPKPPSSDGVFDGSPPSSSGMRFSVDSAKKKRGRPRKYAPDGNIALGLSSTPISSSANSLAQAADSGSGTAGAASEPPTKRNRGRPPGSGKKQLDALGGFGGVGFTPHVITVKAGEDVASKIMEFSQQGPRTICILSATGAICNVTLRQPATTGGSVSYEGRFEIISLSGSFLLPDNNGGQNRAGGLSVSLAGSDGRVLGGGVAGTLMAASPVQVIVGSFIADGKKSNSSASKSGPSSAPTSQMLNFGAPLANSPPQGASSESSDENGSSPLNRDPGIYSNANLNGMNMYQLWTQNQH